MIEEMKKMISKTEDSLNITQLAKKNFTKWNDALQTKDKNRVAECYLVNGELFGTVSGKIRHGRKEIADYFEHFLQSNPKGEVVKRELEVISDNNYAETGIYQFALTKDGEEVTVQARFTYVWQKDDNGEWKILHHHSAIEDDVNEKLTTDLNLKFYDKQDNVETGLDMRLDNDYVIKTGFIQNEGEEKVRFTYLLKNNAVIQQQLSVSPAEDF